MPLEIEITDAQIGLAESVLLPEGKGFDDQRVDFIKNLATLDLHAVPGSGKTTALMAKLIALEQHLPFTDKSGILVLSHTNAAVDEIKSKIGHFCPRLFNYPNYIGTIQSFTDAFLTIPYYKTLHRKRPVRIDNEIYNEHHYPDPKLKSWLGKRGDGDEILYDYRLKDGDQLTYKLDGTPFKFKTGSTFQKILNIKKKIRDDGFLCFDDAYILAEEYITNHPRMINILQKRFKYVFVDEMQDMAKHQYDLLEKLFAGAPTGGYQRIGDKNQAIHNDESDMADVWKERNVKELNGSHRLNPLIAAIVEPLALNAIKITGSKSNSDGTSIDIRPVMLVYNTASVNKVIPKYAKIINELIAAGKINPKSENIFKAVAWTTSRAGDRSGIFKLNHYYPDFSKEQLKLQINYSCLESYLHYYETGPAKLASIRKSILNGLLKVFRLENIQNPDNGRAFTKKTFIEHLKTTHFSIEQKFKLYLYLTAKKVAENKIAEALTLYLRLIKATLKRFGVNISRSKPFIDGKHTSGTTTASAPIIKPNQYIVDGVTIDISTVHAVKGQTHTCTLYMESFYQIAVDSKGQYESSRIADQLQGIALPATAHDYIKQSLKMTYVGFSRPTHLLCFAIHKLRYDQLYSGKPETAKWNIVQV